MKATDWPEVARIYAEGMATSMATFETSVPEYVAWDRAHLAKCRLVADTGSGLLGWAALSPVSGRCVYCGVAEVSIYVGASGRGQGVGRKLLNSLVSLSEDSGIWSLQSGIFPENEASIRLHEVCGFRKIGYREKIGRRDGVWKDNVLFERRSAIAGTD